MFIWKKNTTQKKTQKEAWVHKSHLQVRQTRYFKYHDLYQAALVPTFNDLPTGTGLTDVADLQGGPKNQSIHATGIFTYMNTIKINHWILRATK